MRKKLEEMNNGEEDDSSLVSVVPKLACKKSPSKSNMHPIKNNSEMNKNKSI